jgi:hypothetical protein
VRGRLSGQRRFRDFCVRRLACVWESVVWESAARRRLVWESVLRLDHREVKRLKRLVGLAGIQPGALQDGRDGGARVGRLQAHARPALRRRARLPVGLVDKGGVVGVAGHGVWAASRLGRDAEGSACAACASACDGAREAAEQAQDARSARSLYGYVSVWLRLCMATSLYGCG